MEQVLLAVTGVLLIGLIVTVQLFRLTSRRLRTAESARQQLIARQEAQDMALAVAERMKATLQEQADRVPHLEQSLAETDEARKLAEDELRSLRDDRGHVLTEHFANVGHALAHAVEAYNAGVDWLERRAPARDEGVKEIKPPRVTPS